MAGDAAVIPEVSVPPKLKDGEATKRVGMVVPASWLRKIDDWRRKQPDLPNQSEAIRTLVDQALAAEKKR